MTTPITWFQNLEIPIYQTNGINSMHKLNEINSEHPHQDQFSKIVGIGARIRDFPHLTPTVLTAGPPRSSKLWDEIQTV